MHGDKELRSKVKLIGSLLGMSSKAIAEKRFMMWSKNSEKVISS